LNTASELERRHFQRIFYSAEAVLSDGDQAISCNIVDISMKGCLLDFGKSWSGNRESSYRLQLDLSADVHISMQLRYTHGHSSQAGFACEKIDLNSITNLRRMVELNLGDSVLLERDLHALSGF
jgi:hypothetical protein